MFLKPLIVAMFSVSLVACTGDDGKDGSDGTNTASQIISLSELARYESGVFDKSAAEIVDYDPTTQQTFVVNSNSGTIDVLDNNNAEQPVLNTSLSIADDMLAAGDITALTDVGAANSVAVYKDLIAIAVQAGTKTDMGWVAFYNTDLTYNTAVQVGALPDMVTFTPDGTKVLVANEGEPSDDYSIDPEGSVSVTSVADFSATTIEFSDFNSGGPREAELDLTKMILDGYSPTNPGNKATFSESIEPEYITVAEDASQAFVALQENNAIAVIDLADNSVDKVFGLGFKDHNIIGNEIDASDEDGPNIKNWPIMGTYMPDAIASYTVNGIPYVLTANEGDSRADWLENITNQAACETAGYWFDSSKSECVDEMRVKNLNDDGGLTLGGVLEQLDAADGNTDGEISDDRIGRIDASYHTTRIMNGNNRANGTDKSVEIEKVYSYGARSFSIWNTQTGAQVFDSGSDFERITANRYGFAFNNDNDENDAESRSDAKGPEPEAITLGKINGHTYAFIGLERMGGIMVYDVTNPNNPEYVQYINNRDITVDNTTLEAGGAGDLGPEGFKFVAAEQSPSGKPMLIVGSEVSGTTTYYNIDVSLLNQ